jgi:GTP-binding protein Era
LSSGAGSPTDTRSGFIALAGRPNVGKSTLANAIVGAKIAIVSDKPQTTRRAIRGVATGPDWQLVLVDLPGVQRPRDALTERMQRRVESELADADGCLLVLNAQQGIGPGDRFIAGLLASSPVPVVIAVNKIDRAERAKTAALLQAAEELGIAEEIFPVSARTGAGVPSLTDHLAALLPVGPFYFEPRQRSDQSEGVILSELVREQVLARTREEVPHAVEVEIEDIDRPREEFVRIEAVILVETESQKGILIGARGQMVKSIGVAARRAIERELGSRVHLELSVKVRRHWRTDERLLDRLGIE